MTVRAKFFVTEINHRHTGNPDSNYAEIKLVPVYNDGEENASWSKWTPSGSIEMAVTNPAAVDQFELGKAYFINFTPA